MKILPAIFEQNEIRRAYDEKTETWWFSVIDIIQVLTQQVDFQTARNYWKVLRHRLAKEGSQTVTNCNRLKLPSKDGKMRLTDVAKAETLLRLVQSVPSPKAEPIKLWLAKVGFERLQEMADPALALERARATWQKHGRSSKWIQQRMTGQETRNKLTDYWAAHDIRKEDEYAILTNIIHQEWSGVSVQAHKTMKSLKTQMTGRSAAASFPSSPSVRSNWTRSSVSLLPGPKSCFFSHAICVRRCAISSRRSCTAPGRRDQGREQRT